MKKNTSKIAPLLAFMVALALLAGVGCSKKDVVAIKVDNRDITKSDIEQTLKIEKGKFDPLLLKDEKNSSAFKEVVVEKLIQEAILLNEAAKQNINLTQAELDKIQNFAAQAPQELSKNDFWLKMQQRHLIIGKLINKNVFDKIQIDPKEVKKYYKQHRQDFYQPQQFHARQIIVDDKKVAEDILKRIKKGEDFAVLAKKYSLSPDGQNGGDLGFFDAKAFPPVFAQVCGKLKINEISEVVATDYGFQIFQLLGKRDARQLPEAEVNKKIEFLLKEQKSKGVFEEWFAKLQQKAQVKKDEKVLEEVQVE